MEKHIDSRIYECAICGNKYVTIEERAKCENACVNKLKELEAKRLAEKKEKEKDTRYQEVLDARKKFYELRAQYVKDYGEFNVKENIRLSDDTVSDILDAVMDGRPFKYMWL